MVDEENRPDIGCSTIGVLYLIKCTGESCDKHGVFIPKHEKEQYCDTIDNFFLYDTHNHFDGEQHKPIFIALMKNIGGDVRKTHTAYVGKYCKMGLSCFTLPANNTDIRPEMDVPDINYDHNPWGEPDWECDCTICQINGR